MSSPAAQTWDAAGYDVHARFVTTLGGAAFALLAPQAGERILDIGCGDGVLTRRIAESGATVVGIDSSPSMVEAARAAGVDARLGDARQLDFVSEFDAAFSNAALHWIPETGLVLDGVWRALKPGGRFAGEFGGFGNIAAITTALRAVFRPLGVDPAQVAFKFFPTADEFRELLERHGFAADRVDLIPRPTPLPTGLSGWLDTFARMWFDAIPAEARGEAKRAVIALLEPSLKDASGNWTADYVRLRFAARRSAA